MSHVLVAGSRRESFFSGSQQYPGYFGSSKYPSATSHQSHVSLLDSCQSDYVWTPHHNSATRPNKKTILRKKQSAKILLIFSLINWRHNFSRPFLKTRPHNLTKILLVTHRSAAWWSYARLIFCQKNTLESFQLCRYVYEKKIL